MLIALDRQHDFFAGESFLERGGLRRLRFVPLAVVFRRGMNVVGCRIAVDDPDGLTGYHAEDMGMAFAPALIDGDGFLGNVERAVAKALFHIYENVCEWAAGAHDIFGYVGAFAGRIL